MAEENRTSDVKKAPISRRNESIAPAKAATGHSMLRQLFSSEARQCTKVIARGNPHPCDPSIDPIMYPLARQTFLNPAVLLLACVLVVAGMPLRGFARDPDEVETAAPPPEGVPMRIEVPRGRAVLITLSAYSITSPITRFRIKRTSHAGKLGTPRLVSASTAQVRYQPPAGAGPGDDSFVFEVQSDAGVSAPAEVDITITDKAPLFIAPTDIEFGQVLTGGTVRKSLDLQNIGGSIIDGTIKVPDGWTVDGDPDYHLGPGAKQTYTLIFNPTAQTAYTGDIEYTGNLDRATDLNGEGVGPLAVTTGTVQLTPSGGTRSGLIHVVNHTGAPLTVSLTPGPAINTDASATVPANGGTDIAVSATGSETINESVTVEGQGLNTEVAVYAPGADSPTPPNMTTAPVMQSTPPPPSISAPAQPHAPAALIAQAAGSDPGPMPSLDDNGGSSMSLPPLNNPETSQYTPPAGIQTALLTLDHMGRTDAAVSCDFRRDTPAETYRLELQTIALDAHDWPSPKWIPFPGGTISSHGPVASAQMLNLEPAMLYVVRIVGLDGDGQILEISSSLSLTTPPAPAPFWQRWENEEVAIAIVAAGYFWWRMKKGQRRRY